MKDFVRAPVLRLALVLGLGIALAVYAASLALELPEFDIQFEPGMTLESSEGRAVIEPLDVLAEPGELEKHEDLNRFYQRQDEFVKILSAPTITVHHNESTHFIKSRPRKLGDLPMVFWIPILVGIGSLAISAWIWALRSRDLATAFFALSGASVFISAVPSAIYTTRELAMPSAEFRILETLNAWGAVGFGVAMLALFSVYPVRIPRWRILSLTPALAYTLWVFAYSLQLTPDFANISLIIVSLMGLICVVLCIQYYFTRGNLTARASLLWLGLSVLVGAGAFVVLNTLPLVIGLPSLDQGYAFSFFLIIYLGLAAGITRYRLFEVGQWAFRFLFYAVGAVALVLLDAILVFMLGFDRLPALGIALLAVGFLYLPLRDFIWRFFSKREGLEPDQMFSEALFVAFAPSSVERSARWETLLRKLFNPLEIKVLNSPVNEVEIRRNGLTLAIPSVANTASIEMSYPYSGRALFNNRARELAAQMVSFITQAESNRDAYDRGAAEERKRMARDLHDDVGARLLTGLYIADEKLKPTLQGALADIRSIVSEMSGEQVEAEHLLASLRFECSERLAAAKIEMSWPIPEIRFQQVLNYRQHKAITSAVREILSNVIRHSQATQVGVSVEFLENVLRFSCVDNGKGFTPGASQGHGLKNLKRRLEECGGEFKVESSSQGTKIYISVPC